MHTNWKSIPYSSIGLLNKKTLGGYPTNYNIKIRTNAPLGPSVEDSITLVKNSENYEFSVQTTAQIQVTNNLTITPSVSSNTFLTNILYKPFNNNNLQLGAIGQINPKLGRAWCTYNQGSFNLGIASDLPNKKIKFSSATNLAGVTVGLVSEVELSLFKNKNKSDKKNCGPISSLDLAAQYQLSNDIVFGAFIRNFFNQMELFGNYQINKSTSIGTKISYSLKSKKSFPVAIGITKSLNSQLSVRCKMEDLKTISLGCKYVPSKKFSYTFGVSANVHDLKDIKQCKCGVAINCDFSNN
ncbi:hypothetical protein M0813_01301 [Anaeramoeba flamelloides]|uniref:Uncharacterized protein n=1 Tax=Anaeramoeba flamelloides TaxID=1746091 RepID=A0ABQ8Z969_9EUKA|nr:hypothetical protein M0813_01301 [Anaeramoeba flamelloides]